MSDQQGDVTDETRVSDAVPAPSTLPTDTTVGIRTTDASADPDASETLREDPDEDTESHAYSRSDRQLKHGIVQVEW